MDTRQDQRRKARPAAGNKPRRSMDPVGRAAGAPRRPQGTAQRKVQLRREPQPAREVVYTPAKPFDRNRLLLQIGVIIAIVLAVVASLSLFFKVKVDHEDPRTGKIITSITVSGNEKYSAQAIIDASGIQDGESLLGINGARIGGKIITALPYVNMVRVGIKLPDTVNIEVKELDVVYSVADESESLWWLVTSEGRIVEQTDGAGASEYTKLLGVQLSGAAPGRQASALEAAPVTTGPDGAPQPVTISAADRLSVGLTILRYLESNDVLGQMAEVDVSNLGSITMQYGQRFRILLGDSSDLSYKISLAVAAVGQLREHDKGTLDITFLSRPEVVYTPQEE